MDVLNAKKGRIPLQYKPRSIDEDEISDDDYYVLDGKDPDTLNDQSLSILHTSLTKPYHLKGVSLKQTLKTKFLSITHSPFHLSTSEIEDDYKRESALESLTKANLLKIAKTLKSHFSLGRTETRDYVLFKSSVPKKQKKTPEKPKEKPLARFEDNFDFDLPEKPERRHKTVSEFQQYKAQSSKLKKRPGKRSRDKYRSHKLPEIRQTGNEINFIGLQSPEPEVEECSEDNQMRMIFEGLGLEFDRLSMVRAINHTEPANLCVHCKLLQKIRNLQDGIEKLSGEIETSEEVLNARKMQNKDIKAIIQRLEGSIGTTEVSIGEEGEGDRSCVCSGVCCVI